MFLSMLNTIKPWKKFESFWKVALWRHKVWHHRALRKIFDFGNFTKYMHDGYQIRGF